MGDVAIRIEGLSKQYRIGKQEKYRTIRDTLTDALTAPFKRVNGLLRGNPSAAANQTETIWALKDVSFEVKKGEVIGIIGRNGAGKSTLLKILSRITEPTEGHADVYGRVGALLEVGTGFHPELTGRENIYLNAAILGMSRAEINRKFDEIVAFSEIEKFIDTPVKHYSSGMGLRLGFAVAAHLEPEILIVDEVLAVGDAQFQKKCLGKMGQVAGEGRTVLFVSHNMAAVLALCERGILLQEGFLTSNGDIDTIVQGYQRNADNLTRQPLADRSDRRGTGLLRFTELNFCSAEQSEIMCGQPTYVLIECRSDYPASLRDVSFSIEFIGPKNQLLFTCFTGFTGTVFQELPQGAKIICYIPSLPLAPGNYRVNLWGAVSRETADYIEDAGQFTVIENNFFGSGKLPDPVRHGPFLLHHSWSIQDATFENQISGSPRGA